MMSKDLRSQCMLVPLLGQSVEVALHEHPSASETVLLLHEALGSVAYWKDFPERLALATGANVLLYSRAGQGNSEGPIAPRNRDSYFREVNEVIPALLEHFRVDWPILYGHSEGAGLGMLYAAISQRVKMLILESPFVVALESSWRHIQNMASSYTGSHLQQRLAQYHRDRGCGLLLLGLGSRRIYRWGVSVRRYPCPNLLSGTCAAGRERRVRNQTAPGCDPFCIA